MAAVDVSFGTALMLALLAACFIFLYVRTRGIGRERTSSLVDGLRVEPALDPGRQGAGAVRVERDLLERLDLRRVALRPRRPTRR